MFHTICSDPIYATVKSWVCTSDIFHFQLNFLKSKEKNILVEKNSKGPAFFCMKNTIPPFFGQFFTRRQTTCYHYLWTNDTSVVPIIIIVWRSKIFFCCNDTVEWFAQYWSENVEAVSAFKNRLKTYIFKEYFYRKYLSMYYVYLVLSIKSFQCWCIFAF